MYLISHYFLFIEVLIVILTNTSLFCSELWVLPESKPIRKAYLSDLRNNIMDAFNLRTGNSRKSDDLFLCGEEISLVEFSSGYVCVRFCASGPGSKLFHLAKYFASFYRTHWLGARCRV